jgi:hypothetical protein
VNFDDELDDLLASNKPPNRVCAVAFVYEKLPEDQLAKVRNIIDAGVVPASKISFVLDRHGFPVTDKSIARHRRRLIGGGCKCP